MAKRKRKNEERLPFWQVPLGLALTAAEQIVMLIGLITIGVAGALAIALWADGRRQIVLTPPPSWNRPPIVTARAPEAGLSTPRVYVPSQLPEGVHLVLVTTQGDILSNPTSADLKATTLKGDDAALSPDGRTLAWTRAGKLYIESLTSGSAIRQIELPGMALMPAWNSDGSALAVVSRETTGDAVYQLPIETFSPIRLLSIIEIGAPPAANPATGRLLIAERMADKQTAFYSIDPACAVQHTCQTDQRMIGIVPRAISWAAYHPNATSLVIADRDDGQLYQVATADAQVTPLILDGLYKRRPAFSHDGKQLAYISSTNELYVVQLDTMSTQVFSRVISPATPSQAAYFGKVAGVQWIN